MILMFKYFLVLMLYVGICLRICAIDDGRQRVIYNCSKRELERVFAAVYGNDLKDFVTTFNKSQNKLCLLYSFVASCEKDIGLKAFFTGNPGMVAALSTGVLVYERARKAYSEDFVGYDGARVVEFGDMFLPALVDKQGRPTDVRGHVIEQSWHS